MNIGGLVKFSLIDFPGKVCAIVFTQGCNFRCRYCHNPELVYPHMYSEKLSTEYVLEFIKQRKGKLDALVISGGEPILQKGLVTFIREVRAMGYLVKLHTNGSQPHVLRRLLLSGFIDCVAMDIKGSFEKYRKVCAVDVNIQDIKKSIRMIEESGVSYEFRTTFDTSLLENKDIQEIRSFLVRPNSLLVQECIKRSNVPGCQHRS